MASDSDFNTQELRARRLVWALVGLGLSAGTLMLAAFAFSILRAHSNQTAMNKVAASADRFFFNTAELMARYQREVSTLLAGQRSNRDSAASLLNWPSRKADDALYSAAASEQFDHFYAALRTTQDCEVETRQWADKKSAVDSAAQQADARDDAALLRLQEYFERAVGRSRLQRAVQIRQFRAAGGSADPTLLANIAAVSVDNDFLSQTEKELSTLALLIERMQIANSLDELSDIKDNQFRPALARLQRQSQRMDKSSTAPEGTFAQLTELVSAVFGDGAWNDDEHQTIRLGTNGFFGICQQRLDLALEGRQLQDRIATAVVTVESTRLKLGESFRARISTLAEVSTAGFEHTWWSTLAVAGLCGLAFCLLSLKTAGVLRRQFRELIVATSSAQASELRVRRLIDASLDAVITMNQNGVITGWNTRAERILGRGAAEASGWPLADIVLAERYRRDFGRWIREYLDTGRETGLNQRLEVRALHSDGQEIPVDLAIAPLCVGDKYEFNVFLQDITQRKQNEYAITKILAEATSLTEASPRILAEICAMHNWNFAALWLVDSATDRLECMNIWRDASRVSEEFEVATRRGKFARGVGLPGRAWQEGRAMAVSDLSEEPLPFDDRQQLRGGLRELIVFPILAGDDVLGVLELFSSAAQGANDEMLLTLRTVSGRVGHLIEREQAERALREAEAKSRGILEAIPDVVFQLDAADTIIDLRAPAAQGSLYSAERMLGKSVRETFPNEAAEQILSGVAGAIRTGEVQTVEYCLVDSQGKGFNYEARVTAMGNSSSLVLARDVSDRRRLQCQLAQAQKLESIGQLAAGVAHEINTPIQYVGDNTRFLQDSFASVSRLLGEYGELLGAAKSAPLSAERLAAAEAMFQDAEVPFLIDEIPAAIDQSLEGIERVATIVRAMKCFSHPDSDQKELTDLNRCIENTMLVARNEWKYVADVVTEFDHQLPLVSCLAGEFNQVILNLIVNAAHAIGDGTARNPNQKGVIRISTRRLDDRAEIRIGDNGSGIPEAIRSRVFDPFFTTKEIGRGTGQGLAIAYAVVVEKHGGTISFETEQGRGTTFIIRLPVGDQLPDGELSPAQEIQA